MPPDTRLVPLAPVRLIAAAYGVSSAAVNGRLYRFPELRAQEGERRRILVRVPDFVAAARWWGWTLRHPEMLAPEVRQVRRGIGIHVAAATPRAGIAEFTVAGQQYLCAWGWQAGKLVLEVPHDAALKGPAFKLRPETRKALRAAVEAIAPAPERAFQEAPAA